MIPLPVYRYNKNTFSYHKLDYGYFIYISVNRDKYGLIIGSSRCTGRTLQSEKSFCTCRNKRK